MKTKFRKWAHEWMWLVLVIFCGVGFFYPLIGLVAIICMMGPSVYAAFIGSRGWCGGYCPRGSFNDIILPKISRKKPTPNWMKTTWFRLLFLSVLMVSFGTQLYFAWGNLSAMGMVFVRMIVITTLLTILLGMIFQPRAWCVFCPMGTMAHYVTKLKKPIGEYVTFDTAKCISCKKCDRSCPMEIPVLSYKKQGIVTHTDCVRCGICINKCPKAALTFQKPEETLCDTQLTA